MRRPSFSVIIPTHNRAEMLAEAIQSVRSQTDPDWELIVVDDGSPTLQAVPDDYRIRLMRVEVSQGPAAARNLGLETARGRWVAFLDDDDAWAPTRLEHARQAHRTAHIVVCAGTSFDDPLQNSPGWHQGSGPVHDWILDATAPHLGATSVSRDLCPPFAENYRAAEDLEWWLRMTLVSDRIRYLESRDWIWRRHDGVRHGIGTVRRREAQRKLLVDYDSYFKKHRRARAFRWRRIGVLSLALDEPLMAMTSAVRSIAAYPTMGGARLLGKIALSWRQNGR
ncbi:glycosyltransferase family 2 protein [Granulicoccus sp. GXG6511]|uniref:glycosyltransferase family 2 protein n=1 Tax=Granulicoccus sp. GXG6511 TaxID=3381351 RepID=UPI003D7EDF76